VPEAKEPSEKQIRQQHADAQAERIHNNLTVLRAYCGREDGQYVIEANKVVIVDEFNVAKCGGRSWSDGLHQAVEAKEGCRSMRDSTLAPNPRFKIFRLYQQLGLE